MRLPLNIDSNWNDALQKPRWFSGQDVDVSREAFARVAKRLGVRWVKGEGTHRFGKGGTSNIEHPTSNIERRLRSKAVSALPPRGTSHRTTRPCGILTRFGIGEIFEMLSRPHYLSKR
jgi:hypothetical protein